MSATVKNDLCNRALSLLGEPAASPFSTPAGTTVRDIQCRLHFDAAMNEILTHHRWDFATRMEELASITLDTQLPHLPHSYTLPPTGIFLRFHEVRLSNGNILERFQILNHTLHTDLAELEGVIIYTTNDIDLDALPPIFAECVVYALAIRIASTTTQNPQITEQMRAHLAAAYSRAITTETRQTGSNDYVSVTDLLQTTGIYRSRFSRRV